MRVGKGELYCFNGDVYEGEWFNDKRHGQGKCANSKLASNDDKSWNSDMHNGNGTVPFKCLPDCYSEGEWVEGKFLNGKARHHYCNGEQYVGEWKNGAKCV